MIETSKRHVFFWFLTAFAWRQFLRCVVAPVRRARRVVLLQFGRELEIDQNEEMTTLTRRCGTRVKLGNKRLSTSLKFVDLLAQHACKRESQVFSSDNDDDQNPEIGPCRHVPI